MSELANAIKELSQSQGWIEEFARQMEHHQVYGKPEYQEKINDLRDYANGLSVCTYLVEKIPETYSGEHSQSELLRQQLGLIGNVLAQFATPEGIEAAATEFSLKDADIRRISMSLQGMLELNNLLRQEEDVQLTFVTGIKKPVETSSSKPGFFKKLFGGR